MAKMQKVIINGQEVIGDIEFIRSLLGFKSESVRTTTTITKKANTTPVNELPFEEDLKPSKPKKSTYSKKGGSFEDFIKACVAGTKIYPSETVEWKNEIQHIKGIGYIAVLDSWTKQDTYNVLKECCIDLGGKVYEKSGFAFKTKKECQAFMDNYKVVDGKLRLQWQIVKMNNK